MNTKEKIIDALEDKSTAQILAKEYVEAETKLLEELSKLNGYGNACNCDEREIIRVVFEGEYPEISTYCLKCGGYINT